MFEREEITTREEIPVNPTDNPYREVIQDFQMEFITTVILLATALIKVVKDKFANINEIFKDRRVPVEFQVEVEESLKYLLELTSSSYARVGITHNCASVAYDRVTYMVEYRRGQFLRFIKTLMLAEEPDAKLFNGIAFVIDGTWDDRAEAYCVGLSTRLDLTATNLRGLIHNGKIKSSN